MTRCATCGSPDLVPGHGPWWMGRFNGWLFRAARCGACGEFVHAGTGERVSPLFWRTTLQLAVGGLLIPLAALLGPAVGGRPMWWFAGSFGLWWIVLGVTLFEIRKRRRANAAGGKND